MVQQWEVTEVESDGRTFWVRPVGSWVLDSRNVVADALAVLLGKFSEEGDNSDRRATGTKIGGR